MSTNTDERPNAREREQRLGFVSRPRFEDYREKYATFFNMERRNGILQVHMHTDGGPVMYGLPIHNAWSQLWLDVGNDPDNEVLIFSGTGDKWIAGFDPEMSTQPLHELPADAFYDQIYSDATKLLEAFIFNIDIPTIACINGSGLHTEFALLCDITLCAEHAELFDPHFKVIEQVPAGVCQQCGERYFQAGVYKAMEQLATSQTKPDTQLTIDVMQYRH